MAVQKVFNTATVTVSGLYLATHSVLVTFIGTFAASLLSGWTTWLSLSHRRNRMLTSGVAPQDRTRTRHFLGSLLFFAPACHSRRIGSGDADRCRIHDDMGKAVVYEPCHVFADSERLICAFVGPRKLYKI